MSGGIGTLEELRSVGAFRHTRCALLFPLATVSFSHNTRRRSEFLSVRYLADTIGHTTAAGTYRMKPVALLNTRKYVQQIRSF